MRKVVAYWHDDEGTLVAGCDDGTVWNYSYLHERWEPRWGHDPPQRIPQDDPRTSKSTINDGAGG
jgi:hypothetical protein